MSIVDGAGTEVAVTAPGQVNLSSTSLRLAKPKPKTCLTCGQSAHEGTCLASGDNDAQRGATSDSGASVYAASTGSGGKVTAEAGSDSGSTAAPAKDRQVAFSFTSNLLASSDNADGLAALFRAFYMALDERQISYLQGTIQLVLQGEAAEQIQQRLEELGIRATFKEI